MIKIITIYKELPAEEGKTYKTRFQTGENFTLIKIVKRPGSDIVLWYEGIYEKYPHLGLCPIGPDRLILDSVADGELEICGNCGKPIHE